MLQVAPAGELDSESSGFLSKLLLDFCVGVIAQLIPTSPARPGHYCMNARATLCTLTLDNDQRELKASVKGATGYLHASVLCLRPFGKGLELERIERIEPRRLMEAHVASLPHTHRTLSITDEPFLAFRL